jgi:S1-C subfamily serine protease
MKADDIVEALDGQSVAKLADLRTLLQGKGRGDKLSFRVKRGTETLTIEVTLG